MEKKSGFKISSIYRQGIVMEGPYKTIQTKVATDAVKCISTNYFEGRLAQHSGDVESVSKLSYWRDSEFETLLRSGVGHLSLIGIPRGKDHQTPFYSRRRGQYNGAL